MKLFLRSLAAVVLGLIVGSVINMALVSVGPRVFPPPAGVNMSDPQSLAASVHLLEPRHFVFPFLAHAFGTLAGATLAGLIAAERRRLVALLVGGFFLAGGVMAATMIPAPKGFLVLDLVVAYVPMAWLGASLAARLGRGASSPSAGTR
jgi:hypothetical protein